MSLPENWLHGGFIRDDTVELKEAVQGRQFLRTGIQPTVGQRVDLTLFLTNRKGLRPNIIFSGQVVKIQQEPTNYFPMANDDDADGSMSISKVLYMPVLRPAAPPNGTAFNPCQCSNPDCNEGEMYMSREHWESKEDGMRHYVKTLAKLHSGGVLHNQQVVCEGRLHFDHDSKY